MAWLGGRRFAYCQQALGGRLFESLRAMKEADSLLGQRT